MRLKISCILLRGTVGNQQSARSSLPRTTPYAAFRPLSRFADFPLLRRQLPRSETGTGDGRMHHACNVKSFDAVGGNGKVRMQMRTIFMILTTSHRGIIAQEDSDPSALPASLQPSPFPLLPSTTATTIWGDCGRHSASYETDRSRTVD